jgi:MAF protein
MFNVQPAHIDERPLRFERPDAYVLRLAEEKARAAAAKARPGTVVLGADTTVADGLTILGKPEDAREALDMLRRLRGKEHWVYTAIAVCRAGEETVASDLCATRVPMRNYSDLEMELYVQSGDPLDKAGAYAIQHAEFHPVESLGGCYASVMGLPLCHLLRTMRKLGFEPRDDVPQACQADLAYPCPIYRAVLAGEAVG